MTAAFLLWYLAVRPAGGLRPRLMATKVLGNVNLGLLFGLVQFVTTFAHHRRVRPLRRAPPRPARRADPRAVEGAVRTGPRTPGDAAADDVGSAGLNIAHLRRLRAGHAGHRVPRRRARPARPSDYYAAGRGFTGPQNGIAIAGDYLSAASFLGIAGAIAVNGYDGFLYSIGFLVAWLVALLLVAELLRNTGRSRWATCWPSGCGSARCGRRPRSRRWWSRSSTCSRRWPAPAG